MNNKNEIRENNVWLTVPLSGAIFRSTVTSCLIPSPLIFFLDSFITKIESSVGNMPAFSPRDDVANKLFRNCLCVPIYFIYSFA